MDDHLKQLGVAASLGAAVGVGLALGLGLRILAAGALVGIGAGAAIGLASTRKSRKSRDVAAPPPPLHIAEGSYAALH
jgi:hypothetical protein